MYSNNAVLFKNNKNLKLLKIKIPQLKKGQVLVKLNYTAICKSQLMEIGGLRGKDKFLPHLLGHEGSGVVVGIGQGVKLFKINDEVIITWIKTNGLESGGGRLIHQKVIINYGPTNTFNNYSIISENRLLKKPNFFSFKESAFFGCAIPTGAGMVINQYKNKKKSHKVLVIGLGGIGISTICTLKALNFKNIDICETSIMKINLIKKYFHQNNNFYRDIREISKENYDVIFESTGSASVISKTLVLLKNNGQIFFASHPEKGKKINIDPFELIKGKKIFGSWGGGFKTKKQFDILFHIFKKNKLIFKIIGYDIYSLKDINLAIKDFKTGVVNRPLIKF